jgi:hypothetical protein
MMDREQGEVRITGVFFETGSAELSPVARKQLDMVANELEADAERSTVIEGFADTRGNGRYNLDLSERRAHAVQEYLSRRGVDAGRLAAVGLGENYPVASNTTPTGRAANRRVEISTGADQARPSARALPPDVERDEPDQKRTEESPRQPVTGKDSDFPDDPKTEEPKPDDRSE